MVTKMAQGRCLCQPALVTSLYKKGASKDAKWLCDVCIACMQNYPAPDRNSQFISSCHLLITKDSIDYFGIHHLDQINPRIQIHPATKAAYTKLQLILHPPTPPWMFVSFSKSETTGADLRITDDNRLLQFSGESSFGNTLNRPQLMQMIEAGLSIGEWGTYLEAYSAGSPKSVVTMNELAEKYPLLNEICWLPSVNAPEHIAFRFVLNAMKKVKNAV